MTCVRLLIHSLSLSDGSRTLIPTTAQLLRTQSFLDGRSDFATGPAYRTTLPQAFTETPSAAPDRYIFHVGFCGSTLLSRLLDQAGRSLVLREPNCLADLANQANQPAHDRKVALDRGLAELRSSLRKRWQEGEAVVVKPSNWVNRLLPAFVAQTTPMRALFLTMDRAAFVRAIVRGGPDRLQFIARATLHFSNADAAFPPLVAEALACEGEGPAKLLALAATAHELQVRLMRRAAAHWTNSLTLTFTELSVDPIATARRAAAALNLDFDEKQVAHDCHHWAGQHAKAPEEPYARETEISETDAMPCDMKTLVENVLTWAAAKFGD